MGSAIQKFYYGDAERKTSLGRDWHPNCLRCVQCGRVLSPGQHAEHKGNPYCHTPCYNALFGPSLLGYGSNLASPANFAKKDSTANYGHGYDGGHVHKREIYSNSRGTSAAARRQRQRQSAPPSIIGHDFSALSAHAEPPPGGTAAVTQGEGSSQTVAPLASTRSADNLDVTPGDHDDPSVVTSGGSPLLAGSPKPVSESEVMNHVAGTKSSSSSNSSSARPSGAGHSRSKSEQVVSLDDRAGSFVVVSEGGRDSRNSVSGAAKSPSANSRSTSSSGARSSGESQPPAPDSGRWAISDARRDILEKVESFNSHYEGKVHHQMTVDQTSGGEVKITGPLRVYWGLSRPIQLRQCDDVPALPISKWRHSLCSNLNEGVGQNSVSHGSPSFLSPSRPLRGVDDCVLLSPSSSADEVVMRRQKVRKFNTVAYRSDAPTKWKRASINGHVFNYDTSVFTPVLGSSTTVMADSAMTSPVVIKTLLEKFKVENSPREYVLSVVNENGGHTQDRLLGESDRPLLERLMLGPDDHQGKIFLMERSIEPEVVVSDSVKLPIMEEEEEEALPAEVEQLMILPELVLKGIMVKYEKDEEREVRLLKAKYERYKRKIRQRLEEMKTA